MTRLARALERAYELGCAEQWCPPDKLEGLVALVFAMRPARYLEIGVWRGDSLLPVAIAMAELDHGHAIAVDPWDAAASVVDQPGEHATWWAAAPHEDACAYFRRRVERAGVQDRVIVRRMRSGDLDAAELPAIDIMHVDGNHGPAAVDDVRLAARVVPLGGVLVLDDLDWPGGNVRRAEAEALAAGFVHAYPLGTGAVYRRERTQS